MNPEIMKLIQTNLPGLRLRAQEPMALHTSFRIGGPAAVFAQPDSVGALSALLALLQGEGLTPRILGAGTNVLAPDEGIDGVVISTRGLVNCERCGDTGIRAQCGLSLAKLALFAQKHGLAGLEFAHGIPGTVGGGMYMNAGAYGGEMVQVAVRTRFMDLSGQIHTYEGQAQGLGYRRSAFMGLPGLVLETEFSLEPDEPEAILARMRALMEKRRASQPLDLPSAGSAFKRPVGGYAAALIQQSGLKGFRVGDAAISEKHAGFAVNLGHATARQVLDLLSQVSDRVYADSGIRLEPEIRLW